MDTMHQIKIGWTLLNVTQLHRYVCGIGYVIGDIAFATA